MSLSVFWLYGFGLWLSPISVGCGRYLNVPVGLFPSLSVAFSMLKVDRTFYIANIITGEAEWYFQAREGNVGPYASKQEAHLMLQEFIKENIESKNTGGRDPKEVRLTQATFKFSTHDSWY